MTLPQLPQFLLLSGPRMSRIHFAHELIEHSKNHLVFLDFETPLIDAAFDTIFTHDMHFKLDFNDPATWLSDIPFSDNINLDTWIDPQRIYVRHLRGPDILARILLRDYHENDWHNMWPTIIIRDHDNQADLKTIQAKYGKDSCYCVIIEAFHRDSPLPSCNATWLPPGLSPAEQVDKFLCPFYASTAPAA